MEKLIMLSMACLISVSAHASNWVLLDESSVTSQYIDTDSISISGRYRTVFTLYEYSIDEILGFMERYNKLIILNKIDCNSNPRKYQMLSSIAKKDNLVIHSTKFDANAEWNVIYPDTRGELTADFVCSRK